MFGCFLILGQQKVAKRFIILRKNIRQYVKGKNHRPTAVIAKIQIKLERTTSLAVFSEKKEHAFYIYAEYSYKEKHE